MLKIGIVGFGNLGKSLLMLAKKYKDFEVVAVFSRRKLIGVERYQSIERLDEFVGKIDVLLIATGSFADFENPENLKGKFHTVDCFDNHNSISSWKDKIESQNKISIVSVGWDPGILSLIRGLFSIFENETTATFWGKGVSQGHSNAIRCLDGVHDAIQFTVPKKSVLHKAKNGNIASTDSTKNHERICFVSADKERENELQKEIKALPDYFAPYKTSVHFVDEGEIHELKKDMSHCGCVCTKNDFGHMSFQLATNSNPMFTAEIMLKYAKAIPSLFSEGFKGALDCFDIPLKYLIENKNLL